MLPRATLTLLLLTSSGLVVQARTHDDRFERRLRTSPTQIVERWFHSVAKGDVDEAMKLSSVPFLWDGTEQVDSRLDLRERYDDVRQRRGKREYHIDRIEPLPDDDRHGVDGYCGVRSGDVFLVWIDDDNVGVCVVRDLVVGFRD